MTPGLKALERRIAEASGPSGDLDRLIASTLDRSAETQPAAQYTASVDICLALVRKVLPGWHWHVGHGPLGILPYASLRKAQAADTAADLHIDAAAPTVPLALLHAAVRALIAEGKAAT